MTAVLCNSAFYNVFFFLLCPKVAPGEDVQAAVGRCPAGGAVLLLPGPHLRWHELYLCRDVHLFGRGLALLEVSFCYLFF